jgi:mono/diheme cytochrome c family protein
MRLTLLLTLSAALFLPACNEEEGEEEGGNVDPARIDAILALSGNGATGETVFARCSVSSCHGTGGDMPISGTPTLTAEVPEQSDEELIDIVIGGYETMPAQTLTDQEMADLLVYLRDTFG